MAEKPNKPINIPSKESQLLLLDYVSRIMTEHKKFTDYHAKMEYIDVQYARYNDNIDSTTGIVKEGGIDAATTPVGVMNLPDATPPVVVAQVDSAVAYLAEVFLSGYPLFPVVSSPSDKKDAEQLETLLDDHATIGGYARELLLFLRDGVKYNLSALEVEWASIEQYTALSDFLNPAANIKQRKMEKSSEYYNKLKRLDPYNTIWDHNVSPSEIAQNGDYAGHISINSRIKIKRFLQRINDEGECFNTREALASTINTKYYKVHPQISKYITAREPIDGINWIRYITGKDDSSPASMGDNFEKIVIYVRIVPKDFGLQVANSGSPQIWKLVVINNQILVQAKRIITAYDYLPILFGQPLEDGLGYQTQSVAEASIPYQVAAGTMFKIRFNSARRAVGDRALYDPDRISPFDVNAPVPASKIPVKTNQLGNKPISDAYHPIPFDTRGTENALQDGLQLVNFSKDILGINNPRQGQFQKGNKSVQEWNDTMSGGESRLRLLALLIEFQVMMPLKQILKLNVFQYGQDATVISQKSGQQVKIDIAALRTKVLQFRVADGYTPKSKLAGTDTLLQAIQYISQSEVLLRMYGPYIPVMFAHFMQLLGVRDFSEYSPDIEQTQKNINQAGMMQNGVNPETGQPYIPQLPPTPGV